MEVDATSDRGIYIGVELWLKGWTFGWRYGLVNIRYDNVATNDLANCLTQVYKGMGL